MNRLEVDALINKALETAQINPARFRRMKAADRRVAAQCAWKVVEEDLWKAIKDNCPSGLSGWLSLPTFAYQRARPGTPGSVSEIRRGLAKSIEVASARCAEAYGRGLTTIEPAPDAAILASVARLLHAN